MARRMYDEHNKLALSAGLAVSIIYTICSILVAMCPKQMAQLVSNVGHFSEQMDVQREVTFATYISGLFVIFIFTFILVWLSCYLYDVFTQERK